MGNATSTTGDKDAEINQLNDEIEQLKTQLGNATSTTANTDAAIDQLNDEIDQLKTDLGTATATAGAKDDAIDQLNNQIDQLNGKITQLQQDLTDKETQQPATTDDVTLPSTDGDADTTDQPQVTLPSTGGAMPQTGDEQNSGLTIAGILAAAMSMLGLSYFSRKREN